MKTFEIYINDKKVGITTAPDEFAAKVKTEFLFCPEENEILLVIPYVSDKVKI